jgi:hypothetical protein
MLMTDLLEQPGSDRVPASASLLASNADRDTAAQRLQMAFAEQRLTDDEFDQRIRAALTARTTAELDRLTADLPAPSQAEAAQAAQPVLGRKAARLAMAYKGSIRRSGRWSVPEQLIVGVYKGTGWIDLRAAELAGPMTTIRAIAYKSPINIVLPPGVRVEASGLGVSADNEDAPAALRADAPLVRITGVGYKCTIHVTAKPPSQA